MNSRQVRAVSPGRRTLLAAAIAMATVSGGVFAQSTTGSIFGQATPGSTIQVSGSTGVSREVPVGQDGRYRIGNLPLGSYTVNVLQNGQVLDSRKNIGLTVGAGSEVSFTGTSAPSATQSLDEVTVTANSLPPIDVSSVDSRTVITSQQLARLPLGRNAEAIALLAPGAVTGAGPFGRTVSFGGSGVTENAYYINGYNTADPLKNLGGVGLPYGAIDQQEVYTGGYSAMYGRSDGGVISQVGKRGTNEWHFGAQALWEPKFARASRGNQYFPSGTLPAGYGYANNAQPGTLYRSREGDTQWTRTISGYAGGPLIKDKLYMFVAAEAEKTEGTSTSTTTTTSTTNNYTYHLPKYYAKLDWNINDSNILELTGIRSVDEREGINDAFDYTTRLHTGRNGSYPDTTKVASTYGIAKYTSYLTDDLTFSATYGKSKTEDILRNPGNGDLPYISGATNQNPALNGGVPIRNSTSTTTQNAPDANSKTHGLRADLEWQVGDHRLTGGIDNMFYSAHNEGKTTTGPGYYYIYSHSSRPNAAISPTLGVGAPGGAGYYVRRRIFSTTTSMSVDQKAYYLEDKWQINDRFLLTGGVRNDRFTNNNNEGISYVNSGNQWAPRFGATWDVFGDSSLKVYGNIGRYYLALPNSVAIRGASSSTYTDEYFNYTAIDANGAPTGVLTPLGPGPVSSNGEYGQPTDPKSVTARDLKSQYQDEAILGFDKTLGDKWVGGAKFTLRKLQAAIDDVCDTDRVADKLTAQGVDPATVTIPGCVIFNPGRSNEFSFANADGNGRTEVKMTKDDWGFTEGAKRKYYALDLYMEHPFDGKWYGRFNYTFSKSYGNTEGQVKSDIGQDDVSKTQDWDAAALMVHSNGLLANDRKHQFKAYGSYQLTPEWLVSGTVRVTSGAPKSCLGYFGANDDDPIGYGSAYHSCGGVLYAPGDQRQPWVKQLDLAVEYRPDFAAHKLAFGFQVFNATNEQKQLASDATYETGRFTVSNTYGTGTYYQDPRYARFTVTYDY